jgi:hypothetical protein
MAPSNYQILLEMRFNSGILRRRKDHKWEALVLWTKPIAEQDQEIRILREKEALNYR